MTKFSGFLTKAFHWIFLITITYLFVCSLIVTGVNEQLEDGSIDEFTRVHFNSPMASVLVLLGGLILTLGFYYICDRILKNIKINMNVILLTVCGISFVLAVIWLNMVNAVPAADQLYSIQCAELMNSGDFTTITKGNYLACYPHLLGLVAFLRVLFKIFGDGNYIAYEYFNAICIPVMIRSGFGIVKMFSKDDSRAELFYLLLMLFCIPAYGYVLYIYGDLAGAAFGLLAFWLFFKCLEEMKVKNCIFFFLALVAAISLRKSILIFAVAMAVVMIVRLIKGFSKKDLLFLAVLVFSTAFSMIYVNYLFLPEIADTDHAIPASVNIAMGLNDDYGYAGWYNFYEVNVMDECDNEPELASEVAMNDIKGVYIPLFTHNPKYTFDFFFRKINSQWQDPLYQGIVSNDNLEGQHNFFVNSVYYGSLGAIFKWYMKIVQVMMYGFIMLSMIILRKRDISIEKYALLIAAFGGFVLSLVWESKGRYIFSYFIILLPMFAVCSEDIVDKMLMKCKHIYEQRDIIEDRTEEKRL